MILQSLDKPFKLYWKLSKLPRLWRRREFSTVLKIFRNLMKSWWIYLHMLRRDDEQKGRGLFSPFQGSVVDSNYCNSASTVPPLISQIHANRLYRAKACSRDQPQICNAEKLQALCAFHLLSFPTPKIGISPQKLAYLSQLEVKSWFWLLQTYSFLSIWAMTW